MNLFLQFSFMSSRPPRAMELRGEGGLVDVGVRGLTEQNKLLEITLRVLLNERHHPASPYQIPASPHHLPQDQSQHEGCDACSPSSVSNTKNMHTGPWFGF